MKVINIQVSGITSIGKSHVMAVISKALKAEYGIHTQVCSYDLSVERNGNNDADMLRPKPENTIFSISESQK